MDLELRHIAPYLPYDIKVQYRGIINGKELSDFNKQFNESIRENSKLLIDRPDEKIGLKIGKVRRLELWNKWTKVWVGNKALKLVSLTEIKPLLRPMYDLCKERNGKVDIVELAKIADVPEIIKGFEELGVCPTPREYFPAKAHQFTESTHFQVHYIENRHRYIFQLRSTGKCIDFGFFPAFKGGVYYYVQSQHRLFEYLFASHYDVFGLIDKGLAIDINTL